MGNRRWCVDATRKLVGSFVTVTDNIGGQADAARSVGGFFSCRTDCVTQEGTSKAESWTAATVVLVESPLSSMEPRTP